MVKKKSSLYTVHVVLIAGSVLCGLALAACQPQMQQRVSPTPTPAPVVQSTPAATVLPSVSPKIKASPVPKGKVKGVMTTTEEVDSTLQEMDASLNAVNPSELNGSDLK